MELVNFLNKNSGAIQALMAVFLVGLTGYYAWQTRKTVQTMREIEEKKGRPRMLVYIEQHEGWLNFVDLIISNVGEGVAKDVSFEIENDLELEQGRNLSEIPFLRNGFKLFPSERMVRRYIVSLVGDGQLKRLQTSDVRIVVKYSDSMTSRKFTETFTLDFGSLLDRQLGEPPVFKASASLEKIAISLQKIEGKINRS